MEIYNIPDQQLADSFLIQGTQSNPYYSGHFGQFETIYDDASQEFIFDQGVYYPTVSSYGYICTDSNLDIEDPAMVCSLDVQDIHYIDGANDNLSVFYSTPNYVYGQSPYNPYNPYIPGAVMGMDGSYVAPQQYYTIPYDNHVSSAAYVPVVVQSRPDIAVNGISDAFVYNAEFVNQVDGPVDHNFFSSHPNSSRNVVPWDTATRRNSFARLSTGSRTSVGSSKQSIPGSNSRSFPSKVPPQIRRARGQQDTENGLSGNSSSTKTHSKNYVPSTNRLSGFESHENVQPYVHKVRPNFLNGRVSDEAKLSSEALGEQNPGPRMNNFKNQLVVKAYTNRAGNPDANGNITIYPDQYRDDFFVDAYKNALFFVIKSYSEDDVHKSIKYNVWSSTPNGNKKLNSAYHDAQRISTEDSRGCSVFLFFSVNASGQFCGVAEMTGPVDFHRDMDFWQQDKWSGSFPVKWHIIKDLPNSNLRHIILENNENKSVTNSRDTQEISYVKGLEMLQIYNNYTLKTSLLDDFMYYENRQRILQEERSRQRIKKYENPSTIPLADAPSKFHPIHEIPFIGGRNVAMNDVGYLKKISDGSEINNATSTGNSKVSADVMSKFDDDESKISSLKINSKEPESNFTLPALSVTTTAVSEIAVDVVTIGSMPVKVNGNDLSDTLTVNNSFASTSEA